MTIIYNGGDKGGVGKSFLTSAELDFLNHNGKSWFLVETDTSNPDVFKAYCTGDNSDKGATINIDNRDGWIDLVNTIDEQKEVDYIIINSASRLSLSTSEYSSILTHALSEIDRRLVTAWVINRQRDSLQLLHRHIKALPEHRVAVFRNLFFGDVVKYGLYENSDIKKQVEERGLTLDLPELADRVADQLYSERKTIEAATGVGNPIGNRSELQRWRKLMHASLTEFFDLANTPYEAAPVAAGKSEEAALEDERGK